MLSGKTQESKNNSSICNFPEAAEEDEVRNATKKKDDAAYLAKRAKSSALAVNFSKKICH